MTAQMLSLATLYERFDELAEGRVQGTNGAGLATHEAVLERLIANQRLAEARGWTACARERLDGSGRLRAYGVPATGAARQEIPDWPAEQR
jgi:hypothetical protein